MKTIYIAGWDVFKTDANEIGEKYKDICRKYGFKSLYPLDNEISFSEKRLSTSIFEGNIGNIKQSNIIVANLGCFRGSEPDSGTCFECGVGYALGKLIYTYIPEDTNTIRNVEKYYSKVTSRGNKYFDRDNITIENFNLPLNLMIAESSKIVVGSFEDCIKQVHLDVAG